MKGGGIAKAGIHAGRSGQGFESAASDVGPEGWRFAGKEMFGKCRARAKTNKRAGGPKAPGWKGKCSAHVARLLRVIQLTAVGITTAASIGSKLASRLA